MKLVCLSSFILAALSPPSASATSQRGDDSFLVGLPSHVTSVGGDDGGLLGADLNVNRSAAPRGAPITQLMAVGTEDAHLLGFSVSYAGDVNGDGIDDVIVGAPRKHFDNERQQVGAAFVIFGKDGTLPDLKSIDDLDGTNGFAVYGNKFDDQFGFSVSHAGDLNGDGFSDIIIGAPRGDFGIPDSGLAIVVFGSSAAFPAVVDFESLDGFNGFVIQGNDVEGYLGNSVSNAGDVNGDGIDDVIVGAPSAGSESDSGEAYVIFGSISGFPDVLFISDLNGSNGFTIQSEYRNDLLGITVAAAGDVNGDGVGDILVGATNARNRNGARTGATYVIYGAESDFRATLHTSSLDGSNGYKIYGTTKLDEFGSSLAAVGDINGDAIDDLVVGCPKCRPTDGHYYAGAAFVFYGAPTTSSSFVDAAADANVVVAATDAFDGLGQDVASAGDVNGDGINDVMIASGRGIPDKGAVVYVLYGSNTDLVASISASEVVGDMGTTIPMFPSDFDGFNDKQMSVSLAGDINNDGITDLVVGLPRVKRGDTTLEGHVKVILGGSSN